RDARGCLLHRESCFRSDSKSDVDLELNKLAGDLRKSLGTALSPAIDDVDGATFDPAELVQPLHKCCNPCALVCRSARTKEADGREFAWLLRACRERPHCRRAAEHSDELAPIHCSYLPCSRQKDSTAPAALQDFSLAYVCGVRFGRLTMSAHFDFVSGL